MYPETQLYIIMAISVAFLGISVSGKVSFSFKQMLCTLFFVFVSWFNVTIVFLDTDIDFIPKSISGKGFEYIVHLAGLFLLIGSIIWLLISVIKKEDTLD